jgi:arylsulfatase B
VPDSFLSSNPSLDWPLRKTYEGMVHCLDSAIGNVTAALSAKGMWAQTLMVFSSDNVSTLQPIPPFDCHFAYTGSRSSPPSIRPTHTHSRARQGGREDADFGGNNYPLRGMKFSAWEGGVRVAAWISGGALPAARRGQSEAGLIAICDWRATFAALAGAHAFDFKVRRGRRPRPSLSVGTTVAPLN